jgi:tryptophan halogenase
MNAVINGSAAKFAPDKKIRKIVIVGGGTDGWIAAAALRVATQREQCTITVIDSDEIGTVDVGEATIPSIKEFNRYLGINENYFLRSTQGSFKLATQYVDWKRIGHSYFNPLLAFGFSSITGDNAPTLPPLYQYLIKLAASGRHPDLDDYALCSVAAQRNLFDRPRNAQELNYGYAFQFDAALYAKYLRSYSEKRGVARLEGKIIDVQLRGEDGFIDALVLESGQRIEGDLFIDCSGFRALLLGQALKVPYEDWTHWLPCDRAWAVPCESTGPLEPYTRATAREAGWQWRIPLQHRLGNGYVFSSKYISDERAAETLLSSLEGRPLAEPRLLKFATGRRKQSWTKNCVAVGLSSGFLEPLESTSVHLIQNSIMRLIRMFPERDCGPLIMREYNRRISNAFDWIRDFVILHYHATEREDTEFWRYCKYMSIPDTLAFKIEMFRKYGHVAVDPGENFGARPWLQVMYNQGVMPESYPPLTDEFDDEAMLREMAKVRSGIERTIAGMPRHEEFIARNCHATPATAM